jgi:hypothetical protein
MKSKRSPTTSYAACGQQSKNMNDTEIKACPRCQHSNPKIEPVIVVGMPMHYVVFCDHCKAHLFSVPTEIKAVEEWNAWAGGRQPAMSKTPEPSTLASATGWTARPATPRTNAEEYVSDKVSRRMAIDADFARQLEMELAIMCDFINREMKMTAGDPRIAELEKRIAALSNAGLEPPSGNGRGSQQKESNEK